MMSLSSIYPHLARRQQRRACKSDILALAACSETEEKDLAEGQVKKMENGSRKKKKASQ